MINRQKAATQKADRITRQPDMVNAGFHIKGRSVDGYGQSKSCPACGFDKSASYENDENQVVVICQNCDALIRGARFAKEFGFYEFSVYP